jgi:hypothetical protein
MDQFHQGLHVDEDAKLIMLRQCCNFSISRTQHILAFNYALQVFVFKGNNLLEELIPGVMQKPYIEAINDSFFIFLVETTLF